MSDRNEPETVRPGARISEAAYRAIINSTSSIPPAPAVPQIPKSELVFTRCEELIFRTFQGRSELLKPVRTGGSLTVIVQKGTMTVGRIIVSKKFGQEVYNVWVQHPTSVSGSCGEVAYLMNVANLVRELGENLKALVANE